MSTIKRATRQVKGKTKEVAAYQVMSARALSATPTALPSSREA